MVYGIPHDLVGHGKHVWLHRATYEKEKTNLFIIKFIQICFWNKSAFEANSKQAKAFILRKFSPEHPKST